MNPPYWHVELASFWFDLQMRLNFQETSLRMFWGLSDLTITRELSNEEVDVHALGPLLGVNTII